MIPRRLAFPPNVALIVGSLILVTSFAIMFTRAGSAANTVQIFDWDTPTDFSNEEKQPLMGTGFIPFQSTDFVSVALDIIPSRPDDRPSAALAAPPPGTTDISILALPFVESDDPGLIAYQLASVRYTFNGRVLYISTLQPANLGVTRRLNIGYQYGDIGNGRVAFTSSKVVREGPDLKTLHTYNLVSFVENGLVITLASQLPTDQLIGLAKSATLNAR